MILFRLASDSDFETLAQIYIQSVRKLAPSLYSKAQVDAWSAFPHNNPKFQEFIFKPQTYVMEKDHTIISFSGLDSDGHIASLYVHPFFSRQGYGTKILLYILEKGLASGMKRFYTEASFFSQPLFSRCGFEIMEMETVKYGEVSFDRYKMEKLIRVC